MYGRTPRWSLSLTSHPRFQAQHHSLQLHAAAAERVMQLKNSIEMTKQLEIEHVILSQDECSEATDWVEENIQRQAPLMTSLRLVGMLSGAQGGLRVKTYEAMKKFVVHSYGYEHLLTFHNLQQLGMVTRCEDRPNGLYGKLRKRLGCNAPADLGAERGDGTYLLYGFSSLVARLVDVVASKAGWVGLDDVAKLLPNGGPAFTETQAVPVDLAEVELPTSPTTLVLFLGGVTFTELATLRVLGLQAGRKYLFATTHTTNAAAMVEAALEDLH